jgi:hypothetical protein
MELQLRDQQLRDHSGEGQGVRTAGGGRLRSLASFGIDSGEREEHVGNLWRDSRIPAPRCAVRSSRPTQNQALEVPHTWAERGRSLAIQAKGTAAAILPNAADLGRIRQIRQNRYARYARTVGRRATGKGHVPRAESRSKVRGRVLGLPSTARKQQNPEAARTQLGEVIVRGARAWH